MATAVDVVNEALYMVSQRIPLVTGVSPTFDDSAAGKAAQQLYVPTVEAVGRMFEWDMARRTVSLVASGNVIIFPAGWTEYLYPTNGIEVWQIVPGTIADPNDPLPTTWLVENAVVGATLRKVILTDVVAPIAVYNNSPGPEVWDPGFRETVVRMLASKFADSLTGRPETAAFMLQSSGAFGQGAMRRDS